jgi:hypothetical protein
MEKSIPFILKGREEMKLKPQEINVISDSIKLLARTKAEVEFKDMKDITLTDDEQFMEPICEIIEQYFKEVS